MTRFVLDASVALRWFLGEQVPDYATRVRKAMEGGAQARVPALWHLEMANGLALAERRGVLAASDVEHSVLEIDNMLARWIDSDNSLVAVRQALAAARPFVLTAYDAVYLNLAGREGLPLATLDSRLRAAAPRAGIHLFA